MYKDSKLPTARTFRRHQGVGRIERLQRVDMDPSEVVFLDAIEQELAKGNYSVLGEGNAAYVVALNRSESHEGEPAPWVIKKMKVQPDVTKSELEAMSIKLVREIQLQELASNIIERAAARSPEKRFASIPRTIALLADEQELYIIMDRVPGETLYDHSARVWLRQYIRPDETDPNEPSAGPSSTWSTRKVWECIKQDEFVFTLPESVRDHVFRHNRGTPVMFRDLALAARNADRSTEFPIVTPQQTESVANTVAEWNRAGFLHRDLHGANVMRQPSGEISIIDFGASDFVEPSAIEERLQSRAMRSREITADFRATPDGEIVAYLRMASRERVLVTSTASPKNNRPRSKK